MSRMTKDLLTFFAVTRKEDLKNFKTAIRLCYPNCSFGNIIERYNIGWFGTNEYYQIFDISTARGCALMILNTKHMPTLMSKIYSMIQGEKVWIQFVFVNPNFNTTQNLLSNKIRALERTANKPHLYGIQQDDILQRFTKDHKEKAGKFAANVKGM